MPIFNCDAALGRMIISGEYEQAIDRITSPRANFDQISKETNLCVAYTKSGELDLAAEVWQWRCRTVVSYALSAVR